MGFLGLFGREQASNSEITLPEIPAVDDLDLPPPPVYPKARPKVETQRHEPLPIPQPEAFSPKPEVLMQPEKIEIPIEHLIKPRVTEAAQPEISRERILKAIGMQKPLFVRVDDYREIIDGAAEIRNNLKEASDIVVRMNELKNEEDKEFEKWRLELEDMQRKLMYVDRIVSS
ncbi:MAG: hypothetical protein V1837_07380 [Candidatus Woesearchaeota archaeon]